MQNGVVNKRHSRENPKKLTKAIIIFSETRLDIKGGGACYNNYYLYHNM